MPLPSGEFGDVEEKPLTGGVFEARLDDAKFHGT